MHENGQHRVTKVEHLNKLQLDVARLHHLLFFLNQLANADVLVHILVTHASSV